ncbi:MAG: hypothetical protein ACLPZR_23045 [Solirubrobacteraceae bacterium]
MTGFRAAHAGTAILTARLAPAGRSAKTKLHNARSVVTVGR